ncbi:YaaW family protein [Bacillus sp. Brlt_9]|uniref:YaaW family protein n=1 Tax=Bacillus sp. Brlt_9 TaxID=3110916 RepID=UPI003F7BE891
MLEQSTTRLKKLLETCDDTDLLELNEYIFGKGEALKSREEIIAELQYSGSNDVAYLFRNIFSSDTPGVHYLEIVRDVCDKLNVKWNDFEGEEELEVKILITILQKHWEKADEIEKEKIKAMFDEMGIKNIDWAAGFPIANLFLILGARVGGFMTYQIAVIVANAIAQVILNRGLTLVMNRVLTKGLSIFLGPIGIILNLGWLGIDIAGPAYRKTIPSVVHIAYLRQKQKMNN